MTSLISRGTAAELERPVDERRAAAAVGDLLRALGADLADESLRESPARVARGVGVVIEAEHMCMSMRGARKPGAATVTSALLGAIRTDHRTREEFLALTRRAS